jgi:hypothetical protein
MIREFFTITILLFGLILFIAIDYLTYNRKDIASSIETISRVTKLPWLSLNVAFYEDDFSYYQNFKKRLNYYPTLMDLDKMGFIYER